MRMPAARLADVFERAPTLVARLAPQIAPDDPPESVIAKAREVIAVISERERVGILNAHPHIGADPRTLSALSRAEGIRTTNRVASSLVARLVRAALPCQAQP